MEACPAGPPPSDYDVPAGVDQSALRHLPVDGPPSPLTQPSRRSAKEQRRVKYAKEKGKEASIRQEFQRLSEELEQKREVRRGGTSARGIHGD